MNFERPELIRKIKKRSVNSRSSLIRPEAVGLTLEIQARDLVTLEYCAQNCSKLYRNHLGKGIQNSTRDSYELGKKIMHWKKLCSTHYPSCLTFALNLGRTISLKMQAAECGSRDVL